MLSLPFIVGAVVAGDGIQLRTLAAALTALSIFLLRTPLLTLTRAGTATPEASKKRSSHVQEARFSLVAYGAVALISALYLAVTLPPVPLAALAGGAVLMMVGALHPSLRNRQRSLFFQLASVPCLTGSSLLGYLAVAGDLHKAAFWIWLLFTAQVSVSVLVVHAQLESAVVRRSRHPNRSAPAYARKAAAIAEGLLWVALAVLALEGYPLVALAFLPPSVFHWWSLWRLGSQEQRPSLRRVGITELGTSVIFSFLLLFAF
jgi:hypothetical protein